MEGCRGADKRQWRVTEVCISDVVMVGTKGYWSGIIRVQVDGGVERVGERV